MNKTPNKKSPNKPNTNKEVRKNFFERMQLDIIQRDIKRKELNKPIQQKKLPEPILQAHFLKLFNDSIKQQTNEQLKVKKRLLTPQQLTKIYDKNIEKLNNRNMILTEKRKQKEKLEEEEVLEQRREQKRKVREFFKKHNYISTKESPRFMDRLDDDVERRAAKYNNIKQAKKRLEELRVVFRISIR